MKPQLTEVAEKTYNQRHLHLFMSMIPKKIAIKSYQLSSTCPRSYAGLNYYHNILGSPNHNSACCLLNAYYHVPRALLGTF